MHLKTLFRNVVANWFGFFVNAVVSLALTPYVLHHVGDARYGIWLLTSSITGYYGLLDFGLRGGINQYLTRYVAVNDVKSVNRAMSSAYAALSAVGALILLLSVAAAYFAPAMFHVPAEFETEIFWCILIAGFSSALQCTLFPFSAVFTATQRYDLSNLIGIITRLLAAGGTVVAIRAGWGLIGITAAGAAANILDYLIRWALAYRLIEYLHVSVFLATKANCREMLNFGIWNFLIAASSALFANADTLIIGAFLPVAAVAHYALAANLLRQINSIFAPAGQVFYPAAAQSHARGDWPSLRRLYLDGSRFMQILVIAVGTIAAVWAVDFYRIWIGQNYVHGGSFPSVALLFRILLISGVTGYSSNIAGQVLLGAGLVRTVALSNILQTFLLVVLNCIVVRPYGLIGMAVSNAAVALVFSCIPAHFANREVNIGWRKLLAEASLRPLLFGASLLASTLILRSALNSPNTFGDLFSHGALAVAVAAALAAFIGLNSHERKRFLVTPFVTAIQKVRPGNRYAPEPD